MLPRLAESAEGYFAQCARISRDLPGKIPNPAANRAAGISAPRINDRSFAGFSTRLSTKISYFD